MDSVSTNVQYFQTVLRLVSPCKPGGTNKNEIFWMAIVAQAGKTDKIPYDFKSPNHDTWLLHLAYEVLQDHSKYMFQVLPTRKTSDHLPPSSFDEI